jgi:CelD/BcsL family acetyltransferase involved in cellulose biosynthesis
VPVNIFNPLNDGRWREFITRHPRASAFHSPEWLQALGCVYGYEPVVYTTAAPGAELSDGLVLCRVRSRLTGSRLVSLPFSDHCDILAEGDARARLLDALRAEHASGRWRYVELRPREPLEPDASEAQSRFQQSEEFCFQQLDLRSSIDGLYRHLHKNCIQRKIRRAQREKVEYRQGNSPELLRAFYRLQIQTRRRHEVPPQPLRWFQAIVEHMGENAQLRMALAGGEAIAGMMTLTFGPTMIYKYGCSDARMHHLGATPLLFWEAIRDAHSRGLETLDLGRSDWPNQGLIEFKQRLGAVSSPLVYWRLGQATGQASLAGVVGWVARQAVRYAPSRALALAGRMLYRHIG